jgi:hypothetical protein
LRPPLAQERLRRRSDGRIALELKQAWRDGTRELVFEPLELLERLAAMTPRPETNLLICHGLLAARARWRARVVAYGRVASEPTALAPPLAWISTEEVGANSGRPMGYRPRGSRGRPGGLLRGRTTLAARFRKGGVAADR